MEHKSLTPIAYLQSWNNPNRTFKEEENIVLLIFKYLIIFNRPGVAEAALQTALSLIN